MNVAPGSKPEEREAHPDKARAWGAAFESDLPLYQQFPLTLSNGKKVPGVRVVCGTCDQHLTGDRLRGRVVRLIPHIVTVAANGYCVCCERLTHVDFRLRASPERTVVEWLARNGQWQAREIYKTTMLERIAAIAQRVRRAVL